MWAVLAALVPPGVKRYAVLAALVMAAIVAAVLYGRSSQRVGDLKQRVKSIQTARKIEAAVDALKDDERHKRGKRWTRSGS